MGATSLTWYYKTAPVGGVTPGYFTSDLMSTPGPILMLLEDALQGQVMNGPGKGNRYVDHGLLNNCWMDITLARMRVEVSKLDFAFDLATDTAHGTAADYLCLQRFRTWKIEGIYALSLKGREEMISSADYNRKQHQFLKNLEKGVLKQHDPKAHIREVEATQDLESNNSSVQRNQAIWEGLTLPAMTEFKAIVSLWTLHNRDKLGDEVFNIVSLHGGVDEWSKQYPLGIPSLNHILEQVRKSLEAGREEGADEPGDESEVDDDGEFTSFLDTVEDGEGLDEHLTYVSPEDDDGCFEDM